MTSRDTQKSKRRAFRIPPVLLPVPQSVHANAKRLGKLLLRQSDKPAESRNIARLQLTTDDALTLAAHHAASELLLCEFGEVSHVISSLKR